MDGLRICVPGWGGHNRPSLHVILPVIRAADTPRLLLLSYCMRVKPSP